MAFPDRTYLVNEAQLSLLKELGTAIDNAGFGRAQVLHFLGEPTMDLLVEYRSAIFLLVGLNILLLLLNVIDIYWVWFNFELFNGC